GPGTTSSTLDYVGSTNSSTDRVLVDTNDTSGNAALSVDGTGTLTWNGAISGTHSFFLGGAGVGTIGGVISVSGGNLNKIGAGTWVFTNTNTYTIPTVIQAGTIS